MKKILAILGLVLIISNIAIADEKYRIGAIIPLSGQVASLGNYVKKGIDLALEEIPAAQKEKIEIVYEDDQFDPLKTVSAYRHLKSKNKLDAVFVIGSPPANALGPITEKDKTILVGIGASDPTIAVGKEFSFIHWVIPPVLGDKLVDELARRNLKRVAFVVAEASGTKADADAAIAALTKRGQGEKVVYRQDFLKEVIDYRSALLQIKQKKADAVVCVLFPGALASFAKQFRESKIQAELIGMETFEDEAEVKASNGALKGTWYVNASDSTSSFITSYKQKFGEHPGWGAANGYDTVRLIAAAVAEGGLSNEKVRDFLRSVKDYNGATGSYSSSGDNRFTLPAAVKLVTDAGFETVKILEEKKAG